MKTSSLNNSKLKIAGLVILTLIFSFFVLGPLSPIAPYDLTTTAPPSEPKELENFVAIPEIQKDLLPEVKSTIRWAYEDKRKTQVALLFLHGFSATNQELNPVFETICDDLKINCYFPRLTGHGLPGEELAKAKFDDWLRDGMTAIKVTSQLGDKILLAGNSTGASITLWAEDQFANVIGHIALSPNFRPTPWHSVLGRGPLGLIMTRIIVGPYYEWSPANELRRKYWTWKYPSQTIATLMEMLKVTNQIDYSKVHKPLLVLYSKDDRVVAAPLIESFFAKYQAEKKEIFATPWPSKHVFAGSASNPEGTPWTIQKIREFLCQVHQPFC